MIERESVDLVFVYFYLFMCILVFSFFLAPFCFPLLQKWYNNRHAHISNNTNIKLLLILLIFLQTSGLYCQSIIANKPNQKIRTQ